MVLDDDTLSVPCCDMVALWVLVRVSSLRVKDSVFLADSEKLTLWDLVNVDDVGGFGLGISLRFHFWQLETDCWPMTALVELENLEHEATSKKSWLAWLAKV